VLLYCTASTFLEVCELLPQFFLFTDFPLLHIPLLSKPDLMVVTAQLLLDLQSLQAQGLSAFMRSPELHLSIVDLCLQRTILHLPNTDLCFQTLNLLDSTRIPIDFFAIHNTS
jgi:hypothetical protein